MDIKILENELNKFIQNIQDAAFWGNNRKRIIESVSAGVQSAGHPYFQKLCGVIESHLMPEEFYYHEFPAGKKVEISVVSVALHYGKEIVLDNAVENEYPSYSWYEMTDKFFNDVFEPVKKEISRVFDGNNVIYPTKSKLYNIGGADKVRYANWSERHAAFGCGLGSFGLNGALITEKGCTVRLISFVTDAVFEKYGEPFDDLYANCLYFQNNSCGLCVDRCPAGSVKREKRKIENCFDKEYIENKEKAVEIYGKGITACGLCMSGVPCSFVNPVK